MTSAAYLAAACSCAWLSTCASAWRAALMLSGRIIRVNPYIQCSAHELRRRAKGRVMRFQPSRED